MASIEKRIAKNGEVSYHISVCVGCDANGKKIRQRTLYKPEPTLTARQADKEAQRAAILFEQQLEQGYVMELNPKFREYASYVMDLKLRNGLKRSTYERYLGLLSKINAAIGYMALRDIRPMHLNNLYGQLSLPKARKSAQKSVPITDLKAILKKAGISQERLVILSGTSKGTVSAACKGSPILRQGAEAIAKALNMNYSKLFRTQVEDRPLSGKTILEYHRLISTILAQAEKEMLVPYNAAKKATPPKVRQKDVNYFQPAQVCDMLDALQDEPLRWQTLVQVLMVTGARRGEIAGLKWQKIDWDRKRLKIDATLLYSASVGYYESTTKTGNVRYIPLPQETLDLLRRHKARQAQRQLFMGDRWMQTDFVFTNEEGHPIRPDSITQWLADFSRRKNLPHINPHAFRHTAASVLIAHGTDIVTVSKMLGHTKVSTTEDIYSHVIEESKQQASNALADVYFREQRKVSG